MPTPWTATILRTPPLIAPARQYTYPTAVPGEEDALARGALLIDIKPSGAPNFLATCALGFSDPKLPTGIWPAPNPDDLLAVAGGYAYLIHTPDPTRCLFAPIRPVTAVLPVPAQTNAPNPNLPSLVLLAGFHTIAAIGPVGLAWQTARLTWEGLTELKIEGQTLHGRGWNMLTDREHPFTVDLTTGHHTGGAYQTP